MISIIVNMFSYPLIFMGFVFERLVLVAVNPMGFFLIVSLVIYAESIIIRDIVKDGKLFGQFLQLNIIRFINMCKELRPRQTYTV